MSAHALETYGDRMWPNASRPVSGQSPEEMNAIQNERTRNGDVIALSGEITGPGLSPTAFSMSIPNVGMTSSRRVNDDLTYGLRATGRDGQVDFVAGVWAGGEARVASRADVRSGTTLNLALGDGYNLRVTVEQRPPNDQERSMNATLADAMSRAQENLQRDQALQNGQNAPPPVIFQSPFTNSVIREGDARSGAVGTPNATALPTPDP